MSKGISKKSKLSAYERLVMLYDTGAKKSHFQHCDNCGFRWMSMKEGGNVEHICPKCESKKFKAIGSYVKEQMIKQDLYDKYMSETTYSDLCAKGEDRHTYVECDFRVIDTLESFQYADYDDHIEELDFEQDTVYKMQV